MHRAPRHRLMAVFLVRMAVFSSAESTGLPHHRIVVSAVPTYVLFLYSSRGLIHPLPMAGSVTSSSEWVDGMKQIPLVESNHSHCDVLLRRE